MSYQQVTTQSKIEKQLGSYDAILKAKYIRDDEFYTQIKDIEKELHHWKEKFFHSNVICPCDFDVVDCSVYSLSVTKNACQDLQYSINNVKQISYNRDTKKQNIWSVENTQHGELITNQQFYDILNKSKKCNFLKFLLSVFDEWQINSITVSGFDIKNGFGVKFQDVDYAQYDLCVTNPPFSIYSEFMQIMISSHNKNNKFNFIVISPMMNRTSPNVGLYLMLNQCFLGYGRSIVMQFINADESSVKKVTVDWVTSFRNAQDDVDNRDFKHMVSFSQYKDNYTVMNNMTMKDGTHPIRINNVRTIPYDYDGWMFSSVSVLNNLSYEKYEWYTTGVKKYFNQINKEMNPFNHRIVDSMRDGMFNGIVFRRK